MEDGDEAGQEEQEDQEGKAEGEEENQEVESEGEAESEAEDEGEGAYFGRKLGLRRKKCCPTTRIDELATPNKRIFLALWNEHACHLPKDKVRHLKLILQQLYAMTPEETAKYFAELRAKARAAAKRKRLKLKLRKYLMEKHYQKQRKRAYKLFKRLLKCGILYAAENPVPPLVSIRLRYLSDIILEQLCDLRKVAAPNRSNPDKLGLFLISVADWMAIAVERLYYAAQLSINEITEQEEIDSNMEAPATYEEFGKPGGTSTPQRQRSLDVPQNYSEFGQPGGTSTPQRQRSLDVPQNYSGFGQPVATSTPQRRRSSDAPQNYSGFGQPVATSTPQRQRSSDVPHNYSAFGQPGATSTPQRQRSLDVPQNYSGFGQPGGTSTPQRQSLNADQTNLLKQTPQRDPFYSFMIPAVDKSSRKTNTTVPNYTFEHMVTNLLKTQSFNKSKLTMPSRGCCGKGSLSNVAKRLKKVTKENN